MRVALGWATPLPAAALATQLARLGSAWCARGGGDAAAAAGAQADAQADAAGVEAADAATAALSWQRATAAAVPLLYGALSAARVVDSARSLESAASVLRGTPWVWVGDAFVPPERVAFSGGATADAKPFVYVVPVELASYAPLLRRLGVRDDFGATDYAGVLRLMHARAAGAPLRARWLHIAIATVQALSDGASTADISDWSVIVFFVVVFISFVCSSILFFYYYSFFDGPHREIFVPDADARLCAASALVFDDAPWLSAASAALVALAAPPRLVHHKLSAAVAERLGVRSLRLSLLATSAGPSSFLLFALSAFLLFAHIFFCSKRSPAFARAQPAGRVAGRSLRPGGAAYAPPPPHP